MANPKISETFKKIERQDFVLPEFADAAALDIPLPIHEDQTISQPSTVAFMLEQLAPQSGEKILDVGSGSGWTTALLAEIVGPQGWVFGVERIPVLVEFGRQNLAKYNFKNATIEQAGKEIGLSREAPFERILVSAAAQKVPPELIDQLADGGTMVIPVQNSILKITKNPGGQISVREFPGFAFVPLRSDKYN